MNRSARRRQQHLADAACQSARVADTGAAQHGKRLHHADDRAQQPDHGRDDADDGQVAVARAQHLRLAQPVFGQRVVKNVLAASDAFQPGLQRVGEIVAVGVADFPGFLVIARRDHLLERVDQRRRREPVGAQRQDVLDDKGDHRDRGGEDGAPDRDSQRPAADDGVEDVALGRGRRDRRRRRPGQTTPWTSSAGSQRAKSSKQ